MTSFLIGVATFLSLNLGAGLVRVARGPTSVDRMVAAQLFGTIGVAILLVLSQAMRARALADVALVFVLLATVVSTAFTRRGWVRWESEATGPGGDADQ